MHKSNVQKVFRTEGQGCVEKNNQDDSLFTTRCLDTSLETTYPYLHKREDEVERRPLRERHDSVEGALQGCNSIDFWKSRA